MSLELHISVIDGDSIGASYIFASDAHRTVKIGRVASAGVCLEDPKVARIHAVVELSKERAMLVDMGTVSGTLLNGEPVQRVELAHGHRIELGETVLLVGVGRPASLEPEPESEPDALSRDEVESPAGLVAAPAVLATPAVVTESDEPEGSGEFEQEFQEAEKARLEAVELSPEIDELVLQVRELIDGSLLDVHQFERSRSLTLGGKPGVDFLVGSEAFDDRSEPLVRVTSAGSSLVITDQMQGRVRLGEQSVELSEIESVSEATRTADGAFELSFGVESEAWLSVGGLDLELRYVPRVRAPKTRLLDSFDFVFANLILVSLLFHLWSGIYLSRMPLPAETFDETFFENPDRFASLIINPPKPAEPPPEATKTKKQRARVAPVEEQVVLADEKAASESQSQERRQRKAEIKEQLSRLLGGGGREGAESLLGAGAGSGGSLVGGLTQVIGTRGASTSDTELPTVGLRGGMGVGESADRSRGVGTIQTRGKLGGGTSNYGAGVAISERKKKAAVSLSMPTVMGALDKSVVERVIRENRNQIRYCYEVELQRRPEMAGRVMVSWVIGANGRVSGVKVRESSLGSKRVERCLAERIQTWRFPRPAGGGVVTVNYPFLFRTG